MKHLKLVGWGIGITILQICFSRFFEIKGITPNLLFAFSICYAVIQKDVFYSLVTAGICGLLMDAASSHAFGVHFLAFLYCVLLIQLAGQLVDRDRFWFAAVSVFLLSVLEEAFCYLFVFQSLGISFGQALTETILWTAGYNTVLCIAIYPLLKRTLSDQKHRLRRNRI